MTPSTNTSLTPNAAVRSDTVVDVAIVGAGTAGCALAHQLHEMGLECRLLEKSRGLGGRCSRRRVGDGYSIDLGAAEFTIGHNDDAELSEDLRSAINSWCQQGDLSVWKPRLQRFDHSAAASSLGSTELLCAAPSMNRWHKRLATNADTLTGAKVAKLQQREGYWRLMDEQGQVMSMARKVIITAPAEQAADLLSSVADLPTVFDACQAAAGTSLPQYVCAISFNTALTQPLVIDAELLRGGHPVIGAAIRENSKPGRVSPNPQGDVWVLHSTHEWAQLQDGRPHQQVAQALAKAFCQHLHIETKPQLLTSHYWRLARHKATATAAAPFIWDEALQLGCCGDWLASGDIYGALTSAFALSQTITQTSAIEG